MPKTLTAMIAEATDLVQRGKLKNATALIQSALLRRRATPVPAPAPRTARRAAVIDGSVINGSVIDGSVTEVVDRPAPSVDERRTGFLEGIHGDSPPRGRYRLFVPTRREGGKPRLVVMLHGCTQDPVDFATGTAMNVRAERDGFYVLYPAQPGSENPSRCWNWFRKEDQQRDRGEPALIAGMTRALVAEHGLDPDRVYVAGLSAGGAMSAIVGSLYPDVFAAVGVHSGLSSGSAGNIPDALSIMRTGTLRVKRTAATADAVPTIVFHGDRDTTVHPDNGRHVIDAAMSTYDASAPAVSAGTEGGRRYTRSVHASATGDVLAEHWVVHGAAHAWSGGDPKGSHTDAGGPSATDEMLRFFAEHPRR